MHNNYIENGNWATVVLKLINVSVLAVEGMPLIKGNKTCPIYRVVHLPIEKTHFSFCNQIKFKVNIL